MPRTLSLLILTLIVGPSAAQGWTPAEMMQVKRIRDVQVSPDGKHIVYGVRSALLDAGESKYQTQIYVHDGLNPRALTLGEDPHWSPDGKWIAFTSTRVNNKRNLWLSAVDGKSEPRQLTHTTTGVSSFKWSPDSTRIAFIAPEEPTLAAQRKKKEKNDARVLDENHRMSRLYLVAIDGKKEPDELTKGGYHVSSSGRGGFDWSPDGKTIVYTRTRTPLADDWVTADLQLIKIDNGDERMLLPPGGVRYSPFFSPDGQSIAFVESPRTWAGAGLVHVYSLDTKKARPLADTFDGWGRYSQLLGWSADGDGVYFTEIKGPHTRFGKLTLDNQVKVMQGYGFAADGIHLNATRTRLGLSWETRREPPEVHVSGVNDFKPSSLTYVNAKFARRFVGETDSILWKSKDGLDIEGLLTYPEKYKAGQRYPLLVIAHGGPMGAFTESYIANPGPYPVAAFSSRGYLILRPNPRGSSGYGKKFRYANYGDWGGGDYQDIMAGVDHLIARGIADADKLGIMGWSYGGFMTSWTVTQTKRFKAASVGAGVTNLMSFTGTADIPGFLPDYFGGEFWDKLDAYRKHSPMFHVKGVTTPTLIQHGDKDERVPLSQGLEFYNALKRQNCVTKMVIYPRTPHGIEEPRLLLDCMERNLAWFEQYVR